MGKEEEKLNISGQHPLHDAPANGPVNSPVTKSHHQPIDTEQVHARSSMPTALTKQVEEQGGSGGEEIQRVMTKVRDSANNRGSAFRNLHTLPGQRHAFLAKQNIWQTTDSCKRTVDGPMFYPFRRAAALQAVAQRGDD